MTRQQSQTSLRVFRVSLNWLCIMRHKKILADAYFHGALRDGVSLAVLNVRVLA